MIGNTTDQANLFTQESTTYEGQLYSEEVRYATLLVTAFAKCVRSTAYYPPEHELARQYRQELMAHFNDYLARYYGLVLSISEDCLRFDAQVVYQQTDLSTSLAFQLYRDGVRELRFSSGLTEQELSRLLDIISAVPDANQEDDLVTLLWEQEFVHVDFIAIDDLSDDLHFASPAEFGEFAEQPEPVPSFENTYEAWDDTPVEALEETVADFDWQHAVFRLTDEEQALLQAEVEAALDPETMFEVIEVVFNIFALETRPEPCQDAADYLVKCLDARLTVGRLLEAAELLRQVQARREDPTVPVWQRPILQSVIAHASETVRVERVGRLLDREQVSLADIEAYLSLLAPSAISPLVTLLGTQTRMATRAMLCRTLSRVGHYAVGTLAHYLRSPAWYVVRNIVGVLGYIGRAECVPPLRAVCNHPEPRVRREVIVALGRIGGEEAVRLLGKALEDSDANNRGNAAINLGRIGSPGAVQALTNAVTARDFAQKEMAEIKQYFAGLRLSGREDAVAALCQHLERQPLLGRKKADAVRELAALALVHLGTPGAQAAIAAGATSRTPAIRDACRQALLSTPPSEDSAEEGDR